MQPGMLMTAAHWHVSLEWSEDEQRTLEDHLARFPPERYDALQRYVKLASLLPRKTVRDVALRCKWTINQQLLKKRKMAEGGKGPMGMVPKKPGGVGGPAKPPLMPMPLPVPAMGAPMASGVPPPFLPPGAQPVQAAPPAPGDGMIVDGPIAQLLESNYGILNQFRANMAAFKVAENTQLLMTFRDNILSIINHMESMGGVMDQMPQLPVRLNVDLANNFLPSRSAFPDAGYAAAGGSLPPQPGVNIPGMVPLNGFAPGSGTSAPPPSSTAPMAAPPPPPPSAFAAPATTAAAPTAPAPQQQPPSSLPAMIAVPSAPMPVAPPLPSVPSGLGPSTSAPLATPPLPSGAVPVAGAVPAAPAAPAVKQEQGVKQEPGAAQLGPPPLAPTPPAAAAAAVPAEPAAATAAQPPNAAGAEASAEAAAAAVAAAQQQQQQEQQGSGAGPPAGSPGPWP